jgi:antitoxin component of MazEF toxin-antitoxin module
MELARRKVFRSGNSVVVSLPEEALACLEVEAGSEVELELDQEQRRVVLRKPPVTAQPVDVEFARQVEEFIACYRPALEALARQ